ncbi:hypothetical protein NBRC10512_002239 [Rhodotorula toruloides]|uniref:ubiquitinyl hydrolase 1 n=1 Tax=Rhodotorula toruloides (strain NP11) TaxID=1130832 RepID=M7WZU6_RHOT1|nr:ubiquitin carboxyl-terminal hydrolase 16 [Rhodotorula toruloides NP11]EMS23606.1 ubiquitin carboxyl-terminal hydrolase 16 [Rhodotorula toruloides NP11]
MSYSPYVASDQYAIVDLQPLFSTVASALLILLVALSASSYYLGLDPLTAPVDSLNALTEMASLGVSSLLGKSGLVKLDWDKGMASGNGLASLKAAADGTGENGSFVRRYRDTKEGKLRAEGGGQYFPGLLNAAGNLCFLNATLQSLASLPSLLEYLDQLVSSATSLDIPTPVSDSLLDTLEALNTPSTSRPAPLRPLELANALAASSPSRRRLLASSDQQDAHELWGMIRDAVEEEAGKVLSAQERAEAAGSGLKEVAKLKSGLGITVSKKRSRRGATDPWFWLRSQRIKCMQCGYVRDTRHEGEELLMLQVPAVTSCSLYDLLAEYTKTDLISEYDCRKCAMLATLAKLEGQRDRLALTASSDRASSPPPPAKSKNPFELPPEATTEGKAKTMTASRKDRRRKMQKLVDKVKSAVDAGDWEKEFGEDVKMERSGSAAGKLVRFARTPDILMIHLNRSTHYSYAGPIKNSCQVTFPEYLNVSPFCDGTQPRSTTEDSPPPPSDVYRLSSLVVHYGSHSFGHYVAFRRRPLLDADSDSTTQAALPEWYRISDETVDPSSVNEALRANPFLLFYERFKADDSASSDNAGLDRLDALMKGAKARVVESWRASSSRAQSEVVEVDGGGDGGARGENVDEAPKEGTRACRQAGCEFLKVFPS